LTVISHVIYVLYVNIMIIHKIAAADSPAVRIFCCFTRRRTDSIKHPRAIDTVPIRYIIVLPTVCFLFFFFIHLFFYRNLPPRTTGTADDVDGDGVVYTKNYYKILISSAGYIYMCVCVCVYSCGRPREGKLAVR